MKKPFIIGVAGGPASGKKELCQIIQEHLIEIENSQLKCIHIPYVNGNIRMESFYKNINDLERKLIHSGEYNFDHPEAFDFPLLLNCLENISNGIPTNIPQYDFSNHQRLQSTIAIDQPNVVLISGILILYQKQLRELLDLKIFTDVDDDDRLAKLVVRDTTCRYTKTLDEVLHGYMKYVKPSFEEFILPVIIIVILV